MDEKKMLEQIRKSAEHVDVPEALRPEQVEELIRGKEQRKGRRPAYRICAAAAVVLLLCGAAWQVSRTGAFLQGIPERTDAVAEAVTEGTDAAEEREDVSLAEGQKETQTPGEEAIPHISSEKELYQALAGMAVNGARGMGLDGAVAEGEMMDATAEAAKEIMAEDAENMGEDFSGTNLQEQGVDEGDIVKTDGAYVYVLSGSRIHITKAVGDALEETAVIELPDAGESVEEFYLDGNLLVVIAGGSETAMEEDAYAEAMSDVYYVDRSTYTKVYTYDISLRDAPRLAGSVSQEGYYRTSRKNGGRLYLFTQYAPDIRETQEASSYMPRAGGEKLAVDDVYLPKYASQPDYLVISSVNVAGKPDQTEDSIAIVAAAEQFYVSEENIYISTWRYENGRDRTQILKFAYGDGRIRPSAAGEIRGYLNDSFSMNEYGGFLRAVATDWDQDTERTCLYVLDEHLDVAGKIEDLAPGETVRSARFLGNTGYFVTFRDTDPLFSVDLTDPANPRILGELKVTGFSSYLHFYGEHKLLGIGNEVDPQTGRYLGIKLSMFDITDPADVKEIHRYVVEDSYYCPGLYNYKAILADPAKNILGLECEKDYLVFSYDEEQGFINRFTGQLRDEECRGAGEGQARGLYIGHYFYLSDGECLRAYDMEDGFAQVGELSYGQ